MREVNGWTVKRADESGIIGFGACLPEDEFWSKQINGHDIEIHVATLDWGSSAPCIVVDCDKEIYFKNGTMIADIAKTVDIKGFEIRQEDIVADSGDYE